MGSGPDLDDVFAAQLAGGEIGSATSSVVIAEWSDPGGDGDRPMYIAPLHVHEQDDEAWYVLEGELCVRLAEQDLVVPAGGAVIARRGTPHTYWNSQPGRTRYVLVMTPRIHALIESLHALTERDEQTVAATFRAHASAYLGWPAS